MKSYQKSFYNNSKHSCVFFLLLCLLFTVQGIAQDVTPPTATSFTPVDDAIEIPVDNWVFEITFDEDVQLNTGHTRPFIVMRRETGHNVSIIDITAGGASIVGNVLTLDFNWDGALDASPLEENMVYHIEVLPDVIQDLAGNSYAGFEDDDSWNFYTPDTIGPEHNNLSPSNGSTGVLINKIVEIGFGEQTNAGSGTFDLYEGSTLVQSFGINSADVEHSNDASSSRLTANFSLMPEKTYNVRVSTGAVEDFAGNPYGGITDDVTWTFTTMDDESDPPVIEYFFPENNDPEVLLEDIVSDGVGFEFDEEVLAGSGNVEIRNALDGTLIRSVSMDDPDMKVEGTLVYIYPITEIPYDTEIEITMCNTCLTDVLGNPFPGLSAGDWSFTTEVGPLAIETLSPEDESSNIPIDETFTVTFNQPIQLGINGVTKRAIIRRQTGTTFQIVPLTTDNISGSELSFDHDPLDYEQSYRIEIEAGVIADQSNTSFGGIAVGDWNFTTAAEPDITAPSLTSRSPEVDEQNVDINTNLVMTFDEDVQLTGAGLFKIFNRSTGEQFSVNFSFDPGATVNGNEIVYDIPVPLAYGTEYYIELTNAIEDLAGNQFPNVTGADGWYFTTEGELTPPMLVSKNPESGSTAVNITTDLELTFDEEIQLTGAGLFKMFNKANDEQIGVNWSFASGATVDGNTVTYDIPIDLPYETEIYFEISNAIEDQWGNVANTISGNSDWFITTGTEPDVTAPTIVSLSPLDNETDAPVDSDFIIVFSEPVQKGSGSIIISIYSTDGGTQFIDVNSEDVTISGNTVTIDPPLNLLTDVRFWIRIPSTAFEDLAGNTFAGISSINKDDWDFTTSTIAPDPPIVSSLLPADEATGVALDAELSISFSEDIMLGVNGATKRVFIQRIAGGSGTFQSIDLTVDMISGNRLTVPHDDFEAGITYRIILNEGVITDLDNNAFEGFLGSDWTFTVGDKQAQSITFDALPDRVFGDDPFELSASSTSGLTVMFSIVDGPVSLSGNTVTITGAGTVTVAANQEGNEDYTAAEEVTQTFEVLKADQTISFNPVSNMTFGDAPFNLSATTSSGLDVTFSIVSGPVSLIDDEITITGAGTAVIAANQVGDANFNPAPEEQQTFVITKASQTITIEPIADKLTTDGSFDVVANVDSELELEYSVSGPGTNSDETITLTGEVGTVTVTVSQVGNENYLEASESITFEVKEEEIALALDDEAEIKFYPNPVIDYLMFEGDQQLDVQLMDLNGKVMRSLKARTGKLDVSDLREGMYLLEVRSAQGILKEKIVKTN